MSYGSKLEIIKEKLPKQFIDVGIAEEHAILLANGLSLGGKKPILFIYSSFLQRGYDELIHDVARNNSKMLICIDRAGFVSGDGSSHQGIFDVPMLINIPNIIVTSPKDAREANDLIYTSLNYDGPLAMRFSKINLKYDYSKPNLLDIGSWEIIKDGKDAIIISYGDFVNRALNIANILKTESIDIMVINARFIKPYDKKMFAKLLALNIPIYVYEESLENGSLGALLSKDSIDSKIICFGIKEKFNDQASREELIILNELNEEAIIKKIKKTIIMK